MAGKRKTRSDKTVGSIENPDGRDTRSDKKLGTIRKEAEKRGRK